MKVFGVETKVRFRNTGSGLVSFQSEMIMPGEEKDISLLLLDNPSKVARNYELGAELVGLVVGGKLVKICDCEASNRLREKLAASHCCKMSCELNGCPDCPVEKAPDSPVEAVEEKVEVAAPVAEEKAPEPAPAVVEKVAEVSKMQPRKGK
jgi:hypothetical protein